MTRTLARFALFVALAAAAIPALAQVAQLYYKEVPRDGRVYVFNSAARADAFEKSGEVGTAITLIGHGPNGETVVAENETALDLYNFKHDRPAYARPAPKPAAPAIPTTLKIGDGELRFGMLLQGWYVTDDSPVGTGSSWLGNTNGQNTFRLRRSEIKLSGKITPAWGFEVMFDPSKSQSSAAGADGKILQDLAVVYTGFKGHEIALGQKKIVVTEEGVRSSSELDFAERAQVTRGFSDRRETGLFYKGELGKTVTAYASITNGTPANVNDDSNDTVFLAARLDVKPATGFMVGASGGTSGGEGLAHLGRERYGVHVRYDGPDSLPIGFRGEYLAARDEQANGTKLKRDGFYLTALYTIQKQYQIGVRYDEIDNNKDVALSKIKTLTAGFHWLVKGKNLNLKLDYFKIKHENRKINNVLDDSYSQVVLAAQAAF
jgi:hypothetical protein